MWSSLWAIFIHRVVNIFKSHIFMHLYDRARISLFRTIFPCTDTYYKSRDLTRTEYSQNRHSQNRLVQRYQVFHFCKFLLMTYLSVASEENIDVENELRQSNIITVIKNWPNNVKGTFFRSVLHIRRIDFELILSVRDFVNSDKLCIRSTKANTSHFRERVLNRTNENATTPPEIIIGLNGTTISRSVVLIGN